MQIVGGQLLQTTLCLRSEIFELFTVVCKLGPKSVHVFHEFFAHGIHTMRDFQYLLAMN
jgi:hypothetical protein